MDPVIFKQILTAAAEVSKVTTDEKSGGPHAVTAGGFRAGGCREMSKDARQLISERRRGDNARRGLEIGLQIRH